MYNYGALTTVTFHTGMAGSDAVRGHKPRGIKALIGAERAIVTQNPTVGSGCEAQLVRS